LMEFPQASKGVRLINLRFLSGLFKFSFPALDGVREAGSCPGPRKCPKLLI